MTGQGSGAPTAASTIAWSRVQRRIGVDDDGDFGPVSYAALLPRVAGHAVPLARDLAASIAAHAGTYQIDTSPARLAAFLGQCAHESWGFTRLCEAWGPTAAQLGYEGRRDLGNAVPGDGRRYLGRGLIDITGRANYALFGSLLSLDLVGQPALAEQPGTAVLTALAYWRQRSLNRIADRGDWAALTRAINGGLTNLADRITLIKRAEQLLA